jgi:hypothetical protein
MVNQVVGRAVGVNVHRRRRGTVKNLDREIPEIRQWEVGWHVFDETPASYDFALNSLFDDTAAFQRYFNHPAHLAAIAHWMHHASWVVVDLHV